MKRVIKATFRIIYLFTGLGFIYEMIFKPDHDGYGPYGKRPSNFFLWVIGVYTGLFSIAFQRYENRVNRLYSSFSAYVEQLGDAADQSTIQGFVNLQSRQVPLEPNFWSPKSVLLSFFDYEVFQDIKNDIASLAPKHLHKIHDIRLFGFDTDYQMSWWGINKIKADFRECSFESLSIKPNISGEVFLRYCDVNLNIYKSKIKADQTLIEHGYLNIENLRSIRTFFFLTRIISDSIRSRDDFFYKTEITTTSIDTVNSKFFYCSINGIPITNSDSLSFVANLKYKLFTFSGERIDQMLNTDVLNLSNEELLNLMQLIDSSR